MSSIEQNSSIFKSDRYVRITLYNIYIYAAAIRTNSQTLSLYVKLENAFRILTMFGPNFNRKITAFSNIFTLWNKGVFW